MTDLSGYRPKSEDKPIYRARSSPFDRGSVGRLIVRDGVSGGKRGPLEPASSSVFIIYFPSMPETIELARKANYAVTATPSTPDGIHNYKGTDPLSIPISFKLHSFDQEFCPDGALTLMALAARLQALVLPLGDSDTQVSAGETKTKDEAKELFDSRTAGSLTVNVASKNIPSPPVSCRLELINAGNSEPGVWCNGYVSEVKAILNGPWLKGPNNTFNLPTSAEFSFTFVHVPGHTNYFGTTNKNFSNQSQAMAGIVKDRLYNTRDLVTGVSYRGFYTQIPIPDQAKPSVVAKIKPAIDFSGGIGVPAV